MPDLSPDHDHVDPRGNAVVLITGSVIFVILVLLGIHFLAE